MTEPGFLNGKMSRHKFLRKKNAVIEIQFNWIFILIAGALIIGLAFFIIQKQNSITNSRIAEQVMMDMGNVLTGASLSSGIAFYLKVPQTSFQIDCYGMTFFGQPLKFNHQIVFGPSLLKGNQLTIWNVKWDAPYKVSNFLYFTSPEIRYVFVDDAGNFIEYFNESIPDTINDKGKTVLILRKEIATSNAVVGNEIRMINKNNYRIKFVFVDDSIVGPDVITLPLWTAEMKNVEVTAIRIRPDANFGEPEQKLDGFGRIEFYQKNNDNKFELKGTTNYFGRAALYGAVFSDNLDNYNCAISESLKKLKIMNEVYMKRTDDLFAYADSQPVTSYWANCKIQYLLAKGELDNIGRYDFNNNDALGLLYASAQNLQRSNREVQGTCPLIY